MAHDGSHGYQQDTTSSSEHSLVPPTTTTFVLDPTENNSSGSRIGSPVGMDANKEKDLVVPNATEGGEHGSDSGGKANTGRSDGKNSVAATIAATDAVGDDDDGGELKAQLKARIKAQLKARTKAQLIEYLQQTKANDLEKKKEGPELARQDAEASSMSSVPRTTPPQKPAAAASAAAAEGTGPLEFQTWSAPNVVLSVLSNNEAVINISATNNMRPGHLLTVVMSVLDKYQIYVTSMQVVIDTTEIVTINTRMNGGSGQNPSAENIYKLVVSEIEVGLKMLNSISSYIAAHGSAQLQPL